MRCCCAAVLLLSFKGLTACVFVLQGRHQADVGAGASLAAAAPSAWLLLTNDLHAVQHLRAKVRPHGSWGSDAQASMYMC